MAFERIVVRESVVEHVVTVGPASGVAAYTRLSTATVNHVENHSRIFVVPVLADILVVGLEETFLVTQRHIFRVIQVKVPPTGVQSVTGRGPGVRARPLLHEVSFHR